MVEAYRGNILNSRYKAVVASGPYLIYVNGLIGALNSGSQIIAFAGGEQKGEWG
jgi:hypothetical protein